MLKSKAAVEARLKQPVRHGETTALCNRLRRRSLMMWEGNEYVGTVADSLCHTAAATIEALEAELLSAMTRLIKKEQT